MKIAYKNTTVENIIKVINAIVGSCVIASFVLLFGFDKPVLDAGFLYDIQAICFIFFVAEKIFRFLNAVSKKEFLKFYWLELPLLMILLLACIFSDRITAFQIHFRIVALGVYLVFQVIDKLCRTCVTLAASGRNPMRTLVITFMILILGGAGFLSLPRSYNCQEMNFVDALFTATSATCVTGLVVKDTGTDFSRMGQVVILTLIQLGGLGIVIFGAVFALLVGQAFSVRESVAMQDLLNAQTLGRIGNMIGFIFVTTLIVEAIGAMLLMGMWGTLPEGVFQNGQAVFYSIFHSISAFCNAGFSLFNDSLMSYSSSWQVYFVICPLIIMGGLGFGVLYNIANVFVSRVKFFFFKLRHKDVTFFEVSPKKFTLQSKIVLVTSLTLILVGAIGFLILEQNHPGNNGIEYAHGDNGRVGDAIFQSVTARTAGFNTIDNSQLSEANKLWTILLMLIGGSPGSTAGGIKTVTLVVIVMAAYATMVKRSDVEIYRRSIRYVIVGRAITVVVFFALMMMLVTFGLCLTERNSDSALIDIMFEAASALGTVGLSTGLTPALTTAGKLIIIAAMLIGRLGPLTLLATLTFNLRVHKYNYPDEPVIVG